MTSHDSTKYFVSLPANKLELWFALEAERFRAPVFRELYSTWGWGCVVLLLSLGDGVIVVFVIG